MTKLQKPIIDASAFVADNVSIHGNVEIQKDCSIYFHATLRSETERVTIGEGSNIQDNCVVHTDAPYQVTLGKHVTVGHSAILHGCTIGDETMIGMGSIVMNGSKIGKNCLVGAGSLITQGKVFPDGMLIMGSPAKAIRPLTPEEIEMVKGAAQHYIECGRAYKEEL